MKVRRMDVYPVQKELGSPLIANINLREMVKNEIERYGMSLRAFSKYIGISEVRLEKAFFSKSVSEYKQKKKHFENAKDLTNEEALMLLKELNIEPFISYRMPPAKNRVIMNFARDYAKEQANKIRRPKNKL